MGPSCFLKVMCVCDDNRLFTEQAGSKESMEATNGMVDSMETFVVRDNVKALMSMGEAWKRAFNDSVGCNLFFPKNKTSTKRIASCFSKWSKH